MSINDELRVVQGGINSVLGENESSIVKTLEAQEIDVDVHTLRSWLLDPEYYGLFKPDVNYSSLHEPSFIAMTFKEDEESEVLGGKNIRGVAMTETGILSIIGKIYYPSNKLEGELSYVSSFQKGTLKIRPTYFFNASHFENDRTMTLHLPGEQSQIGIIRIIPDNTLPLENVLSDTYLTNLAKYNDVN
ncbi:MAG: hypothetical protein ACP5NV_04915 [Candidatus Woesearchaeota archaeon]